MKFSVYVLALALLGIAVGTFDSRSFGQAQADKKGFMRGKLTHSQQILEALALEDYAGISHQAEQLRLLSLDANWQVLRTEDYLRHSGDFRRAAAVLKKKGEEKNLDGAVLAYFQLTQSCVNCHRHVRAEETDN